MLLLSLVSDMAWDADLNQFVSVQDSAASITVFLLQVVYHYHYHCPLGRDGKKTQKSLRDIQASPCIAVALPQPLPPLLAEALLLLFSHSSCLQQECAGELRGVF